MKIEKTLENLRKLNEAAKAEVLSLSVELESVQFKLDAAKEREITTGDAIAALTGAPTLKKMLEEALAAPKSANADIPKSQQAATSPNLPPAEPGFKWVKNGFGEDVLVSESTGVVGIAASEIPILPAIEEDEGFTDSTEDFINNP